VTPAPRHAGTASRSVTRQALIAALNPDGSAFERCLARHRDLIDWPWLLERAKTHKVAALVAARVEGSDLAAQLDPDIRRRLQGARQVARRNAQQALYTLREISPLLDRAGVPFAVLKGVVLAEQVYQALDLRSFVDTDLVVPPAAVAPAEAVLRSLGYRLGQIRPLLGRLPDGASELRAAEVVTRWFYERFHYELPLVPEDGDERMAVDLHWRIAPSSHLRATVEQLWQQAEEAVIAGQKIRTLNRPATLIHLAVHAATCSLPGFKLLPLCDIAWALSRFRDGYEHVWELARAWRAQAQLAAVLHVVEQVLHVPLPETLLRSRPPLAWRPGFAHVATAEFLVDHRRADLPAWQHARAELEWNLAMRCLRHNVVRNMGVRLARLQWHLRRRGAAVEKKG
jgi:hypothetical protein